MCDPSLRWCVVDLKKLYSLFQKSLKIKWGLICWTRLHNISFFAILLKSLYQESSWILKNLTGNTSYECIVQVIVQKSTLLIFQSILMVISMSWSSPGPEPIWLEFAEPDLRVPHSRGIDLDKNRQKLKVPAHSCSDITILSSLTNHF